MAFAKASKFFSKSSSLNSFNPILVIISACSLTLNSIYPYFASFILSIRSPYFTKVPLFTLGIKPLGPRILARDLRDCICSGVAINLSKGMSPSANYLSISSSPKKSAPAALASFDTSLSENTHTFTSLPIPAGRTQVPLMFWFPYFGSTPSFMIAFRVSLIFS